MNGTIDKPAEVVKSMDEAGVAFSVFNGDIKVSEPKRVDSPSMTLQG